MFIFNVQWTGLFPGHQAGGRLAGVTHAEDCQTTINFTHVFIFNVQWTGLFPGHQAGGRLAGVTHAEDCQKTINNTSTQTLDASEERCPFTGKPSHDTRHKEHALHSNT